MNQSFLRLRLQLLVSLWFLSLVTWLQRGSHFPTLHPYLHLLSISENRIFEFRYASVRCHSPPPQLNITGFLWMTVLLLWSACYLLSCECFFSLIFHDSHTHAVPTPIPPDWLTIHALTEHYAAGAWSILWQIRAYIRTATRAAM